MTWKHQIVLVQNSTNISMLSVARSYGGLAVVMETALDQAPSSNQQWLELPGVRVIDLLRERHGSQAADTLQRALAAGCPAEPDPRRRNFYEASIDGHRYYFHVLEARPPKVFLLARWPQP